MHFSRTSQSFDAPQPTGASVSRENDEENSGFRVSDRDYDRRASPPRRPDRYRSYGSPEPLSMNRYDSYRPGDVDSSPPNVRHVFRREESDIHYRGTERERRANYDYRRDDRRGDCYRPRSDGRTSPSTSRPRPAEPRSSPPRQPAHSPVDRDADLHRPAFRNLTWTRPVSPPKPKRQIGDLKAIPSAPKSMREPGVPSAPRSMRFRLETSIPPSLLLCPHIAISSSNIPVRMPTLHHLQNLVAWEHSPEHVVADSKGYVLAFQSSAAGREKMERCFKKLQHTRLFHMYDLNACMELFPNGRSCAATTKAHTDVPSSALNDGSFLASESAENDFAIRGAAADGHSVRTASLTAEQGNFAIKGAAVKLSKASSPSVSAEPNPPSPRTNSAVPSLQTRFGRDTEDSVSVASVPSASDASGSKLPKCHVCKERTGKLLGCSTCPRHYDRRCLNGPQVFSPEWQCPRCQKKGVPLKRQACEMLDAANNNNALEEASPVKKLRLAADSTEIAEHAVNMEPVRAEVEVDPQPMPETSKITAAVVDTVMPEPRIPHPSADRNPGEGATVAEEPLLVSGQATLSTQGPHATPNTACRPPQDGSAETSSRYEAAASLVRQQVTSDNQERAIPAVIDMDSDEAANLVDESFNSPEKPAVPKKAKKLKFTRRLIVPAADNAPQSAPDTALPDPPTRGTSHPVTDDLTVPVAPKQTDVPDEHQADKHTTSEHDAPIPCPVDNEVITNSPQHVPNGADLVDATGVRQEGTSKSTPTLPPQPAAEDIVKPDILTSHLRDPIGSASPVDSVMTAEQGRSFAKRTDSRTKPSKSVKCTECKVIPVPSNPFGFKMCPDCIKSKKASKTTAPLSPLVNGSPVPRTSELAAGPPSRAASIAESFAGSLDNSRKVADGVSTIVSLDEQHAAIAKRDASTAACADCRRAKRYCEHRVGALKTACSDCRRAHIRCVHTAAERRRRENLTKEDQVVTNVPQPRPDAETEQMRDGSMADEEVESDENQDDSEPKTSLKHRRKRQGSNSALSTQAPNIGPAKGAKGAKSTSAHGLGSSYSRPAGVYRRLLCMAMCDSPGRRLTSRGAAEWVARNIPGYKLGESNWADGLRATMYGQDGKIHSDKKYLRRLDWKPSFGGKPTTIWFGLLPGLENEVEHWDASLGQPVSPMKQAQASVRTEGPSGVRNDQSSTPSKPRRRARADVKDDEMSLDEESASAGADVESSSSRPASEASNVNEAMSFDRREGQDFDGQKDAEMAGEELSCNAHNRSIGAPTVDEDTVMEDVLPAQQASNVFDTDLGLVDHLMDHDTTATTSQQLPAPIAPMLVTHRSYPAPTRPAPEITPFVDGPLDDEDQELCNIMRDLPPVPNTSTLSLATAYPQYFLDRRAKIAEIKARPTRKQQINARMAKLNGKGNAVVDTTAMRERESREVRVLDTESGIRELPGDDVSLLKHCATLEEFLGLDRDLVPDVVDKQLVYRKNDGGKSRTIYKTGL